MIEYSDLSTDATNATPSDAMRLVIVESPFAGIGTTADRAFELNVAYARACLADCLRRGEAPFASHLLYPVPGVIDDDQPHERALGMNAGFSWGRVADATVVYTDRGISQGMHEGIHRAQTAGRPVEYRTIDWKSTDFCERDAPAPRLRPAEPRETVLTHRLTAAKAAAEKIVNASAGFDFAQLVGILDEARTALLLQSVDLDTKQQVIDLHKLSKRDLHRQLDNKQTRIEELRAESKILRAAILVAMKQLTPSEPTHAELLQAILSLPDEPCDAER